MHSKHPSAFLHVTIVLHLQAGMHKPDERTKTDWTLIDALRRLQFHHYIISNSSKQNHDEQCVNNSSSLGARLLDNSKNIIS